MEQGGSGASYPIASLFDMAAIPEEALPRFLAELPTILAETRRFVALHKAFNSALEGDAEISFGVPKWIDDDLNQLTSTIHSAGEQVASTTVKRPLATGGSL